MLRGGTQNKSAWHSLESSARRQSASMKILTAAKASSRPRDPQLTMSVKTPSKQTLQRREGEDKGVRREGKERHVAETAAGAWAGDGWGTAWKRRRIHSEKSVMKWRTAPSMQKAITALQPKGTHCKPFLSAKETGFLVPK